MTALLYLIKRTYTLYYCLSHVLFVLHDISYIILCLYYNYNYLLHILIVGIWFDI